GRPAARPDRRDRPPRLQHADRLGGGTRPELSTVVVSWASKSDALALAANFPADNRHELLLVDNGDELSAGELRPTLRENVRIVSPGRNLGFAGGATAGAREARAPALFFLNPDTEPDDGAFDRVIEG